MKTVITTGGNLYQLAARYLNDASQWNRIAQANGLIDPVLLGTVTLTIPDIDPGAGGGIYSPPSAA